MLQLPSSNQEQSLDNTQAIAAIERQLAGIQEAQSLLASRATARAARIEKMRKDLEGLVIEEESEREP